MNKKTLIIIIASVLAVAIIATGVILVLKNSFEKKPVSNNDVSSIITSSETESTENSSTSSKAETVSSAVSSKTETTVSKGTVITVESVSGKVGKKVTVPVSIKDNPGFMAMLLQFDYDASVLKYKGYTQGDFLTNYQFNDENGTLRFLNLEDKDVKNNGVLVNLEFEILSEKAEKTDIKLVVGKDSIANQKEELISAKSLNGTVTINK